MKRTLLIILSFLFILVGCSNTSKGFTEEDWYDVVHTIDVTNNTISRSWNDTSITVIFDDSDDIKFINMDTVPEDNQILELIYTTENETWVATYTSGEVVKILTLMIYLYTLRVLNQMQLLSYYILQRQKIFQHAL